MATKNKAATAKKTTPAKTIAKPTAKKPVAKPAPKKAVPAKKAIAKPAAKKVAVKKVVAKAPAKKATAKPVAKKPVAAPAKKAIVKQVVKSAVKPVAKKEVVVVQKTKAEPAKASSKKVAAQKPIVKKVIKASALKKKVVAVKREEPQQRVAPPPFKKAPPPPPPRPTKVVVPEIKTKTSKKYEPDFTKSVLDSSPAPQTGPSMMRYSDAELSEFRELIQKKLDAAKKELAYLQGLITRKDEMGGDESENRYMTMEDGGVSMEREQLSQMASRQITFIDHLEKAMMRIENKTYGICRVTGKLIDKARLRAVPHATLSIEAKQLMSK